MSKLILPNPKIDAGEEIMLPAVRCTFCDKLTTSGMKQTRLQMIEPGQKKIVNGKILYKPPRMKRIDYFMCPACIKKGTKWPGQRP